MPADIDRIDAIERETRHDVIAFLTWLAEAIGPGQPVRAPGHDQLRRAGHLPVGAADAGGRPAAGGPRRGAGGAEGARVGAQVHADHRPQPRHPRRADDVRFEARRALCRVRAQPRAAGGGAGGDRGGGDRRRRWGRSRISIRAWRSTSRQAWAGAGAGVHAGHPARPARGVLRHAGGDRLGRRAAGDRGAPPAAQRGARGGGVLPSRARRAPARCRTSGTRC